MSNAVVILKNGQKFGVYPTMKKPVLSTNGNHHTRIEIEMREYNDHLLSLEAFPLHESLQGREVGSELENVEKDYQFSNSLKGEWFTVTKEEYDADDKGVHFRQVPFRRILLIPKKEEGEKKLGKLGELVDIPKPIGDFILAQKDIKPTMTGHGALYHYADVCTLLNRLKSTHPTPEGRTFTEEEMNDLAIRFAVWVLGEEGQMYRATVPASKLLAIYKDRPYINMDTTKQ